MKETKGLERGKLILIHQQEEGTVRVTDYREKETYFEAGDDFSIYFKNARFKPGGVVEAVYLGVDDGRLIDGDCVDICYFSKRDMWLDEYGIRHKEARLVAARSETLIIIIEGKIDQ